MNQALDLRAGYGCNNNCVFCVWREKRARLQPMTFSDIERHLREGRSSGAERLVLSGGEAAMHGSFLETIAKARELGYAAIQVQSNGRVFCYEGFCQKVIEAGATEFGTALQGSTAPLHDFLTGTPGSYLQTVTGIVKLRELGQKVFNHTVITKTNYRDLPELVRLLHKLDVGQFQLSYVHAGGAAEANKTWLMPRYGMAEPWIKETLRLGDEWGMSLSVEGVPYCVLRGFERFVAEPLSPRTVSIDSEERIADLSWARRSLSKARDARCDECIYSQVCEGPWKQYPELFGWSEFEPFPHGTPVAPAYPEQVFVFGKNGHVSEAEKKKAVASDDDVAAEVLAEAERLEEMGHER